MVLITEPAEPLKRCCKCGESKPLTEFHRRSASPDGKQRMCRACTTAVSKQRYADNKEAFAERRKLYYAENAEQAREDVRAYAAELKEQVLAHYGTACACCRTTDDLTLDHVNGDGRQHREEVFGDKEAGGTPVYRWIIDNGFPEGFQTLCRPCNRSKGTGARCVLVHELDDELRVKILELLATCKREESVALRMHVPIETVRSLKRETASRASGPAAFNSFGNGLHVQSYPSAAVGAQATATTIGGYPQITASLRSGAGLCGTAFTGEFLTWSGGGYTEVC